MLERNLEEDNAITLDNPALLTNFVNRLLEKFRIQSIQRALDYDNIRTYDNLMKFIARCLHTVQRDPDEWADTVSSLKKAYNTCSCKFGPPGFIFLFIFGERSFSECYSLFIHSYVICLVSSAF